jgi:hypothetical protein
MGARAVAILLLAVSFLDAQPRTADRRRALVLENLTLIDGTGAAPVTDARIVIEGERIRAAGRVNGPNAAERVDLGGATVLPGLIDAHLHIEKDPKLVLRQLAYGVTSFRDPGQWMEAFEPLKALMSADRLPGPRFSMCGPHIDGENPAYPLDSYVARDPEAARRQAERAIAGGATAVKIYFRLPLESALAVIEVCRKRRVVSTAHLEIVDARDLLRGGLNGLEHITSFAVSLMPPREAEKYRQAVLQDNTARTEGRYRVFASLNLDGPEARDLFDVVRKTRPFIDATLAVFEVRPPPGDKRFPPEFQEVAVKGFAQMKQLTLLLHRNGGRVVLGGHTNVRFAGRGEAPLRELELLVESGLTPMEAIQAATLNGAQFLFRDKDLGSIENGKLADLIVMPGDPLKDISAVRRVERVMIGGTWIDIAKYRSY